MYRTCLKSYYHTCGVCWISVRSKVLRRDMYCMSQKNNCPRRFFRFSFGIYLSLVINLRTLKAESHTSHRDERYWKFIHIVVTRKSSFVQCLNTCTGSVPDQNPSSIFSEYWGMFFCIFIYSILSNTAYS